MFREIRKHERVTDKFEEEKGFMSIKPVGEERSLEELQQEVLRLINLYHEEIMASMQMD